MLWVNSCNVLSNFESEWDNISNKNNPLEEKEGVEHDWLLFIKSKVKCHACIIKVHSTSYLKTILCKYLDQ